MGHRFRKLGHLTEEQMERIKAVKVKISVLSFIAELAIKYDNEKQLIMCQLELERYKTMHEDILGEIYEKTGVYPGRGQVEILRGGDILEFF